MGDPVTVAAKVLAPVAGEGAKWSLEKIIKHIGYIFKYKKNLKDLEDAKEDLDAIREDGVLFGEEAISKVKVVGNKASRWMSTSEKLSENAKETISRNNISCLNVCARYSKSKTASKMTPEIKDNIQNAPEFGNEFKDATLKYGDQYDLKDFMELKSRESVVNDVIEELKKEEVRMCSMVGMGGTGKTMLAMKLLQKVEDDRSFDQVVMVTVSDKPDYGKIQKEIIELLKMEIDDETMSGRAIKLRHRLTKKKTLLILDDVWSQFTNEHFRNIGIPAGCKLVVTSRNEDECTQMGSQRNFRIEYLDDEEAWDLFKHIAGKRADDNRKTAEEIARKCGGLPLVINTLAAALKDKDEYLWNDTLLKLQRIPLGISELEEAYFRIHLSYNLLKDKEAQTCFRLCSLFPEDYNVSIEDLIWFGKGLELFEGVQSMKEARDRVKSKINKLKNSFLLHNGQNKGCVRMHDLLRDFAISISSKDERPYIVGFEKVMEKWPERAVSIKIAEPFHLSVTKSRSTLLI